MKKIGIRIAAVATFGCFAAVGASSAMADKGSVTETKAECALATAVLLVGNSSDAETSWTRIRSFLEAKKVWTVGAAQPGVAGTCEPVQWDVVNPRTTGPNAAYSCRCGSGGTCNEIAKAFLDAYPEMQPAPVVFCGDLQNVLSNPSSR